MTAIEGNSGSVALREPVRFLVFSASLRAESYNSRLARLAANTIEQHGGMVDLASMENFDAPSYDQDVQQSDGFPPGAAEFRRRIEANDAFILTSVSMLHGASATRYWSSASRPAAARPRRHCSRTGTTRTG
jgi:hypothetical protein